MYCICNTGATQHTTETRRPHAHGSDLETLFKGVDYMLTSWKPDVIVVMKHLHDMRIG